MCWGQESGAVVLVISLYLLCMQISFVVASALSSSGSGPILFNLPYFFFDTYCITILTYFSMPYTLFSFPLLDFLTLL